MSREKMNHIKHQNLSAPARFMLACVLAASCVVSARGDQNMYRKFDDLADRLLEKMTLAEKIGQMTQADLASIDDYAVIGELFLGSVLSGGNSDPEHGNTLEAWTDAYDACQQQSLATRLGIPLLYGIDAVHGHNNVLGAVIFPHNVGLGCTENPELIQEIGRLTALEVRATGMNWTFAPCITVPRDDRWGRTYEGFSEDPALTTRLGLAAMRGLQGNDLSDPLSILACAKHYTGDGGTAAELRVPDDADTDEPPRFRLDQGDTRCSEEELRRVHISPYVPAIEAGVGSVMVSYSSWNGEKCTGSKQLLSDILKKELGFEGIVISDWNAIDQVDPDYKAAIRRSINAGIDMAMVPDKYRQFITLLTELVRDGEVPIERIDNAVRRILRVKAAMGLLETDRSLLADCSLHESFGADERRVVAREAVRQSLVLLKNENSVLPLDNSTARIHVAGSGADDLGRQCGGWTIQWQGATGEVTPGGTTILQALRNAVDPSAEVSFAVDGTCAAGATAGLVVVSEEPYAEGEGDDELLRLSDEDLDAIRNVEQAGIPLVVVVVSGRPLVINEVLQVADAVVAAWLPGTEGTGVVDVLLGDFAPTGRLSFSWPRSADQHPINVGDTDYDPLFEFGYGLTYGD